ncbi:unnamed protein product, partial [Ilex paraguariensis]
EMITVSQFHLRTKTSNNYANALLTATSRNNCLKERRGSTSSMGGWGHGVRWLESGGGARDREVIVCGWLSERKAVVG